MDKRVLVVDDEAELVRALTVRLSANGFTCDSAGNGKDALMKAQAKAPDIIIVDLIMPVMDGYELCRLLHADEKTSSIPVLVLTAVPQRALASRLKELGPVRIMHKPFDSEELLTAIRDILRAA